MTVMACSQRAVVICAAVTGHGATATVLTVFHLQMNLMDLIEYLCINGESVQRPMDLIGTTQISGSFLAPRDTARDCCLATSTSSWSPTTAASGVAARPPASPLRQGSAELQ